MTGKFYIDNKDAYANYGIFVAEGGYNGIVSFPPLKKVDTVDWAEEDGVEVDLSSPALDTREFPIQFVSHSNVRTGAFIELLSDKAYHTFEFRDMGRTYILRMVSQPNLDAYYKMEVFSLQLANDFPLDGYTYAAPYSTNTPAAGYEIDEIDLSKYGIQALQGSINDILKSPSVKKNLTRAILRQHGTIYDGEIVKFQTKEVKLNCLMRATTLEEFWRNYNALLFNLVRPGERSLYVDNTGYEYPCYYKSCNVSEFYPTGKIWFKFDLTLVFTSFRIEDDEYLLASEAGEWIMTEDGEFAIDLRELTN